MRPINETRGARGTRLSAAKADVLAGQWRWRWDLNPRKTCAFTRFRGVRPRPLGDSTAAEPTRRAPGRSLARADADRWPGQLAMGGPAALRPGARRRTRAAGPRTPRPGFPPPPRPGG